MLLLTFLVVGGVIPIVQEVRGGAHPIVAEAIFFVVLVAACYVAIERRVRFVALVLVGLLGLAVEWSAPAGGDGRLVVAGTILLLFFFASVAGSILLFILRAERVTAEIIAASLCVYLLMGLTWALSYSLADSFQASSFQTVQISFWDLVYYSFATLTTSSYDGIAASSRLTKSLACVESIAGQFYVAVLVSRLVGMHIAEATSAKPIEGSSTRPAI